MFAYILCHIYFQVIVNNLNEKAYDFVFGNLEKSCSSVCRKLILSIPLAINFIHSFMKCI